MTLSQRRGAGPSPLLRPRLAKTTASSAAQLSSLAATSAHLTENEIRQPTHSTLEQCHPAYVYQMNNPSKSLQPRHLSVYKGESIYDSYGPVYNLGSNPDVERYYNMLFRIDEYQCWISSPVVPSIKLPQVQQQPQYFNPKRGRLSRQAEPQEEQQQVQMQAKALTGRRRCSTAVKTPTVAAVHSALVVPSNPKQTQRRASGSSNSRVSNATAADYPNNQLSVGLASVKPSSVVGKPLSLPQLPPPKELICKRPISIVAKLLRRITSFLDEEDAVELAKSCRLIYEILDYSWWTSVYRTTTKDEKRNLVTLWPCSNGWCDCCEIYTGTIFVHEISKARLCATCTQLPELQDMRISEAKQMYKLTGKYALFLIKMVPFNMHRKGKMLWKPHVKWVHEMATADSLPRAAMAVQLPRASSSATKLFPEAVSCRQIEQPTETKKRTIRLKFDGGSKSSDKNSLTDPPTSSTIELQSSIHDDSSASYRCESRSLDDEDEEEEEEEEQEPEQIQAQKRQKIFEEIDRELVNDFNPFSAIFTGSSRDDIAREVRYNYLKTEAIKAGMRMPEWGIPLTGTLLQFINGEWEEVAKQGIGINDFGAMIQHLRAGTF